MDSVTPNNRGRAGHGPARLDVFFLLAITGLALAARLAAVQVLGRFAPRYEQEWEIIARHLVQRGVFAIDFNSVYATTELAVTSFIPPLYPAFLALMRLLFAGEAGQAARLAQAGLSTVSVVLVYLLGMALLVRRDVAVLAALFAAVFPPFVASVVEVNPATFEVLWILLFVLLALPPRSGSPLPWWRWVLAGVALGLAALTRAPALILLPWLPLCLLLTRPRAVSLVSSVLRPTLVVAASAAAIIAPWTVRNYVVQGEFIAISSNGGINFWIGNNPLATGEFIYPPEAAPDLIAGSAHMSEAERDRYFYGLGLDFARQQPRDFVRLLGQKLFYSLWVRPSIGATYGDQPAVELGRLAYLATYAALLAMWLLGALAGAGPWRRLIFIYGPILGMLAVNTLYFAGTRFRTPAAPFQLLLAGYLAAAALLAVRGMFRRAPQAAAGHTDAALNSG